MTLRYLKYSVEYDQLRYPKTIISTSTKDCNFYNYGDYVLKKLLLTLFVLFGLLFVVIQPVLAEIVPAAFLNHNLKFYQVTTSKGNDLTNVYLTEGFEQNKTPDMVSLIYSKTGINLNSTFAASKQYYGAAGTIGSAKKTKYKMAISFLEKSEGGCFYKIIKIEDNKIAGSNVALLKINVPADKANIKTLDQKYFQTFYKTIFPNVLNQNGETVPHIYPLNLGEQKFVLKYSAYDENDISNYYLPRKQNFYNYKSIVRVNTRSDINSPEKLADMIVQSQNTVKGFKLIANETCKKDSLISYTTNEINLKQNKKYISYSIFKITPVKKGVVSIQYSIRIPDDEKAAKTISNTEQTYRELLKTYEVPELIREQMGMLPDPLENDYMEQTK